ncbi:MAG: hypothetical protein KFF77_07935, partial [Bacteroidetes bacterium]|nr:hypothetical protein [Bacteroidota bacterium]
AFGFAGFRLRRLSASPAFGFAGFRLRRLSASPAFGEGSPASQDPHGNDTGGKRSANITE